MRQVGSYKQSACFCCAVELVLERWLLRNESIHSKQVPLGKARCGELACICKRLFYSLDLVLLCIFPQMLKLLHHFGTTGIFKRKWSCWSIAVDIHHAA